MRATTSLALFALATGSTNAIFCFIKEKKCLPGVELSLDYDKIPGLLGITVTKSSTMTGTATQSSNASTVVVPATPVPGVDTSEVPQPANIDAGFLEKLLKKPAAIAEPSTLATPAAEAPAIPGVAAAVTPAAAPTPTPAPVPVATPEPMPAAAPAVEAVPAPAARAPEALSSPTSPVPDWLRNLIPRSYEAAPPAYNFPAEANAYGPASQAAELPSAYVSPALNVYSVVPSVSSIIEVTATYSSSHAVDVTTTITEWATVTPTHTVRLSESYTSQKVIPTYAAPNSTATQKQTYATLSPKPSATQHETISLTTTVEVWVSAATFSTVASYTAVQKPVEVPTYSYSPVHGEAGKYPIPSNVTTIHSMSYNKPTQAKPTVYVTPVPASYSPGSMNQNMSNAEMPEQYTGAAAANTLNLFFMMAAGVAAMMVL